MSRICKFSSYLDSPIAIIRRLIDQSIENGSTQIQIKIDSTSIGSLMIIDNGNGISNEFMRLLRRREEKNKQKRCDDGMKLRSMNDSEMNILMNRQQNEEENNDLNIDNENHNNCINRYLTLFHDLLNICQEIIVKSKISSNQFIRQYKLNSKYQKQNNISWKYFPFKTGVSIHLRGLFYNQIGRKRILLSKSQEMICEIYELISGLKTANSKICFKFNVINCGIDIKSFISEKKMAIEEVRR